MASPRSPLYSSSPSPPPPLISKDSGPIMEEAELIQMAPRVGIEEVATFEIFFLSQYRFIDQHGEYVRFKPGFLEKNYHISIIGQVAHNETELGMVKVSSLSTWNVTDKRDKNWKGGRIWMLSSKAWYVLFSPHEDYKPFMNEWPEIVDLENCVHQAAKEGEAKTLEEVKLDASLGVGSYSLPLEDGLNLIYKHAASIYDNRDQSLTSPLYDQLRERINSNRAAKSVGEFPIAALDTQRHFHALIASKIEMSRIQSFPPIPEEVTVDQVELREGPEGRELILNQEGLSIKRGSFVLLFRDKLTKVDPWIFIVVNVKDDYNLEGIWAQPWKGSPQLGRFQDPAELIPDFTRGLEELEQSFDTIYCILDVVILDPGMLPPENQWFVRVKYQIEDSCHIYSTFCLEDLDRVEKKKPTIKPKPGDWIEYVDPRYEKSLDPERVTGRVKEVKKNLQGRITSVVVQRTILSDVLISSPTPEGSLPPAHLSRLQIEAVRPKKNSREIILLLERGSRSKLAEMEVEIEKVYGFISVFVSCRDMLMADVLPDSKFEYRMIAGTFDATRCDEIRLRNSKSGLFWQCHPNDFDESLAEKLFPDKGFYFSPEMEKEYKERLDASENKSDPLQVHDYCCGLGGWSSGLQSAGMEIQLGVDMDTNSTSTFKRNFPDARVLQAEVEDLSEQMGETVDEIKSGKDDKWSAMIPFVTQLIAAGPSCKGFSTANPYRANAKHTENYFTILSIIAYLMPAYVVIENVPSLVNSKIGNEPNVYFKLILSILISLGYQVTFGNIIASELGVPQSRARLFFLCTRRDLPLAKLPEATHKIGPKSRGKILMGDADEKKDRDPLTFELFKTERIKAPFPLVNFEDATSDLPSKVVPIEQGEKKMRYASVPQNSFQRLMRGDRRGPNSNLLARLDDVEEEKERIANQLLSDHTSRHPSSSSATPSSSSTTKRGPRILPDSRQVVENLQKGPLKPEQIDSTGRLKFYQTPHQPNNEHYRFTRVDPNTPTPTWTSQNQPESHRAAPAVHPYENRLVSDAEAKRVHSFPDGFKFQEGLNPREKFRLLGQAVPPLVAKAIGESIIKANKEAIRLGLWNDSIDEQKKLILELSEFGEKALEKELNKPLGNRSLDVDDFDEEFEEVSDASSEVGQGSQNGQAEDLEEQDMMDVDVNDDQGQVNEDEEMQMDEEVEDRSAAAAENDGEEAQEVLMML